MIDRSRLLAHLDRTLEVGVGVISAGAGYGKSTLLSAWLHRLGPAADVIHLALGSSDHEGCELARHVRAVIGEVVPLDGDVGVEEAVGELVRHAASSSRPVVFAVDESGLPGAGNVFTVLARELRHRPTRLVVVVSGRGVERGSWRDLPSAGHFVEVDSNDLRFDDVEAGALLRTVFGIDVTQAGVGRLQRLVEGWVTGLCLAARARQHVAHSLSIGDEWAGCHPAIRRYLEEEVLREIPADRLDFLERTSVLHRLDPELCDVLSGRTDSYDVLARLVDHDLFVAALSDEPLVFRSHPAFARSLRTLLWRKDPDAADRLRASAADWYEARGLLDAAIDMALDGEDFDRATTWIRQEASRAINSGREELLVGWLEQLPAESLWGDDGLAILMGEAAGLVGNPLPGQAVLRSMPARLADARGATRDALLVACAQLEVNVRLREGRLNGISDGLVAVQDTFDECEGHPVLEMAAIDRGRVTASLGLAYLLEGRLEESVAVSGWFFAPADTVHPTRSTMNGVGVWAFALALQGDEQLAAEAVRYGRLLSARFGGRGPEMLALHAATMWCATDGSADDAFGEAAAAAQSVEYPLARLSVGLAAARMWLNRGEVAYAADALSDADAALRAVPEPEFFGVLYERLRDELAILLPSVSLDDLNQREREILELLARGASRAEIAAGLHLSINTVKTYLRTAYRKLGASSRDEAVGRAVTLGVVPESSIHAERASGDG